MTRIIRIIFVSSIFTQSFVAPVFGESRVEKDNDVIKTALNGLAISVDRDTGGILSLEYEGVGKFLETDAANAGILDLAYPIQEFEPLRLASRYSRGAQVTASNNSIIISWSQLGASRAFDLPGSVSATVIIKADDDSRSVIFSCVVENRSSLPVKQALFPDLKGILPFAGEEGTEFRGAGLSMKPFRELQTSDLDRFYATNASFKVLETGDLNDTKMIVRWMDLGSLRGGFSLFPRRWGWDARTRILLRLSDRSHQLRLMSEHSVDIESGDLWSSGEFCLTPHKNGWAKGIEVYREWAREHMQREYPLPKHVRDGLGFRSVWMCQNQPNDPQDAVWAFKDLGSLAREAKEHGLSEMVMWIWHKPFVLPFPPAYSHLGGEQEMVKAVIQCKELGVNIAPFVSVLQAEKKTAERYGLTVKPGSGNWTYHTELIPRFNPLYASGFTCAQADTTNIAWQEDVLSSCKRLIESGIPSLCWDQYWSVPEKPNLNTLTSDIRKLAKRQDPESTFAGEELRNFEINSNYLDYTWNWGHHEDIQPLVSVFQAPRINVNINDSPEAVKQCFADNLYVNVWPLKPDSPNGSDWIANHKGLSLTLKECARLRSQFLAYFTDGTFISNCILTEPCPNAHVSAYVLPNSMLIIVINTGGADSISPSFDLQPWLSSQSGSYAVKSYGSDGRLVGASATRDGNWRMENHPMKHLEIALFELAPD